MRRKPSVPSKGRLQRKGIDSGLKRKAESVAESGLSNPVLYRPMKTGTESKIPFPDHREHFWAADVNPIKEVPFKLGR
jgi:hypothetical protein